MDTFHLLPGITFLNVLNHIYVLIVRNPINTRYGIIFDYLLIHRLISVTV